jgi:hypothetical protein
LRGGQPSASVARRRGGEEAIAEGHGHSEERSAGAPTGAGECPVPAAVGELSLRLGEGERRALLEIGSPGHERLVAAVAAGRARLEEAAADALARGHSLADLSAAAGAARDDRERLEATGRLSAACARLGTLEQALVEEAEQLGGEVPADRAEGLRRSLSHARADFHAAVRAAILRGVPPQAVLDAGRAAALDLEESDLMLAFEERGHR